jgi:predicted pyridoxine 5'-phosphate oxidase superfamily flavin-nucleotide-binding protein
MPYGFLDTLTGPSVVAAQEANDARAKWEDFKGNRQFDRFTENETAFIATRDSFYLASVSETGWPYVQHRGGPAGFVKVLDDRTLVFPDFRGNRQYLTPGNIGADDRVSLILVDYPNRARLKVLGHMRSRDLRDDPELAEKLALPGYAGKPERAFVLDLVAFDWNCQQHFTQRFTVAEINSLVSPLYERIAALEEEINLLRSGG